MSEVLAKSVTRDDQGDYRNGRGLQGVLNIFARPWAHVTAQGLPSDVGLGWSTAGDAILRSTLYYESMWAGAISKAITKIAAQGWTVKDSDDSTRRTKLAQDILLHADGGKGWVPFISKHLRSFLLTRNGAFVEIVRASKARGSKVMGLVHLSPFQCQRTGDPDYPVLYTDRHGAVHPLRDYQVLAFADMPDDDEHLLDTGFPAVLRAYRTIYKLSVLERYIAEKISGNRALAIHFVAGLSRTKLESALKTAEAEQTMKGATAYKGAIVVPVMTEEGITIATVPLAEIPDGFDAKTERDNAYLIYANAIGVPVQDIQPLSGQGLGTGTQTQVLDDAAEGQGLAAWRKWFEQAINEHVLPGATTFTFSSNDVRDQKAKAEVQKIRQETRGAMIESGMITPAMGLQLALDADDVPPEFVPNDATAGGQLTDTEKPVDQAALPIPAPAPPAPAQPTPLRAAVQRAIAKEKAGPDELERLLASAAQGVSQATAALQAGEIGVDEWQRRMETAIDWSHYNAYELGAGESPADESVAPMIDAQREYLSKFAQEISEKGWQPSYSSRAQMYAQSAKASYWAGATRGYALPAVPGDGTTQCLTNCNCKWRIVVLEGDGNVDAYWEMSDAEHCQTCVERAAEWAPYRIRDREVVL